MLTYHIGRRWRWAYAAATAGCFVVPPLIHLTFTGIGHLSAFLIGLAFYPITRGRTVPSAGPLSASP